MGERTPARDAATSTHAHVREGRGGEGRGREVWGKGERGERGARRRRTLCNGEGPSAQYGGYKFMGEGDGTQVGGIRFGGRGEI